MPSTTQSRTPIQVSRLRIATAQLGWTATDLHRAVGDELGINYPSVRDILNGKRKEEIPSSWLKVFAEATGQDYEWLSGFEGSFRELTPAEVANLNRVKGLFLNSGMMRASQPLPQLVAA
jgi:hypothetical protein